MKATEARELSKKNEKDLNHFKKMIEQNAKNGSRHADFFEYVSDEVTLELIKDGYNVGKFQSPSGEEVTRVNW